MTHDTRPTRATERPASAVMNEAVTEDSFKRMVIEYAQLHHWLVHHARPAMNRRGKWATWQEGDNGFPDLTLARRGKVIFAELKSEKGKPSDAQLGWLVSLPNSFIWKPSDWPQIEELLK